MPVLLISSADALADEQSDESNDGLRVKISRHVDSVRVKHEGRALIIQRNQDIHNTIHPDFARTSRKCPPFCIQPMILAPGVETVGEREMLDYLSQMSDGDDSILVIDSRTPRWLNKGTIPGSVNIPYKRLTKSNSEANIVGILVNQFDVKREDRLFNFKQAKTLVLFCNGPWCGQAPTNIRALLKMGYPPEKLKYYRGGMQMWELFGLTTVRPPS